MKRKKRRNNELIMLSAYLDDELNLAERRQLEKRLDREPALRERLDNLSRTKIILGSLARLKAPRSFTLSPEMATVRRKKNKPFFTLLKLASSLAAVLLIFLVGVELVLGGGLRVGSQTAAEAPLMEADTLAEQATPEPLIIWGDAASGGAGQKGEVNGYGGGNGGEGEILEYPESEEAAPTEEIAEEGILSQEMAEEAPEEEKAAGEAEQAPILGLKPDEGGEIVARSDPAQQEREVVPAWMGTIRWIEVALAVIAVGGGVMLWLLRKK